VYGCLQGDSERTSVVYMTQKFVTGDTRSSRETGHESQQFRSKREARNRFPNSQVE